MIIYFFLNKLLWFGELEVFKSKVFIIYVFLGMNGVNFIIWNKSKGG